MMSKNKKINVQLKKAISYLMVTVAASVVLTNSVVAGESKNITGGDQINLEISCMGYSAKFVAQKEAKYHHTIIKYADQYGLNPNLIKAVVSVESCYDHNAVSSAGAEGLMQLMPKTAKWLGVTNSMDSEQNLEAGIRYLSKLRKRYNNNNKLALAAYNAGPGNVKKHKGIPPFPETQAYVVKVEKRFQQYQMLNQLALNITY